MCVYVCMYIYIYIYIYIYMYIHTWYVIHKDIEGQGTKTGKGIIQWVMFMCTQAILVASMVAPVHLHDPPRRGGKHREG